MWLHCANRIVQTVAKVTYGTASWSELGNNGYDPRGLLCSEAVRM